MRNVTTLHYSAVNPKHCKLCLQNKTCADSTEARIHLAQYHSYAMTAFQ